MLKAAVVTSLNEKLRELLVQNSRNIYFCFDAELTLENINDFDFIFGNPNPSLLKYAKKLQLLQLQSAGVDGYTNPALYGSSNTLLCNASGAYGLAISECLLAMHLFIIKKLHCYRDNMSSHVWADAGAVSSVQDSTIIVLGTGDIGTEYAKRVRALGAYVIGVRRTAGSANENYDEMTTVDQLDEVLPRADAVVLCLPGTEKTKSIMNRQRLFAMKQGAVLLNIGRGNAVDSTALVDALNSGHLSGAAIDVTDPEPLPSDNPLWDCKNLLITPHITGGDHLMATFENIVKIASGNMNLVAEGKTPPRIVNLKEGY